MKIIYKFTKQQKPLYIRVFSFLKEKILKNEKEIINTRNSLDDVNDIKFLEMVVYVNENYVQQDTITPSKSGVWQWDYKAHPGVRVTLEACYSNRDMDTLGYFVTPAELGINGFEDNWPKNGEDPEDTTNWDISKEMSISSVDKLLENIIFYMGAPNIYTSDK